MAKDFGAEALKGAIENSSQIERLKQRIDDLERDLKKIQTLLAPKDRKKPMSRELALASKRRAMSEAAKRRWPKKAAKKRKSRVQAS